jgi:hypothetical protein
VTRRSRSQAAAAHPNDGGQLDWRANGPLAAVVAPTPFAAFAGRFADA